MNHLFSYIPPERLSTFSYGHVIPKDNLTVHPVVKGILNSELEFTYEKRGTSKIVSCGSCHRILINAHSRFR
jgi:chromosome transmission fidelity protein 1